MGYGYSIPKREKGAVVYTVHELYVEYQPIMLKKLKAANKSEADAEDIVQDVFEKLIRNWDKIIWDQIENLLSRVLYNAVVDHYSRFVRNQQRSDGNDIIDYIDNGLIDDPFRMILGEQFSNTLKQALSTLSKSEKQAFLEFYRDERTVSEIAGTRHVGTVLTLLFRARNKVSKFFEHRFEV